MEEVEVHTNLGAHMHAKVYNKQTEQKRSDCFCYNLTLRLQQLFTAKSFETQSKSKFKL